jgi:filamentous hemagglutinin
MQKNLNNKLTATTPVSLTRRVITWLTLIAYVGQPLAATAQIVAAPNAPANSRPVIDTTANGIPLVQIAAPNSTGLSHNQFSQYNVDPNGIILNNSNTTVLTQQAGYVPGNQNMANGTARIILNEVTGTSASQLNGYTEVAGSRAEVIIANPNGIACNGCGFINTSRGVLTTGVPVFGGSGSLDAFRVTGGQISVDAGGLNGNNTDQLDLIARSVKVNGNLWAHNLNVVAGANQVNYANLGIQIITGSGNKPTVGIDVAQLGGMYANKIRLVGTEAGVGVNSLGSIAAQAGDFNLDSQGQITLAGSTSASGNISINSNTGITNTGTLSSQQTTQLTTTGNILNGTGAILNGGNTVLNAATGDITNNGYLYGNQVNTLSNNLYNNYSIIGTIVNLAANNLYNTGSAAFIGATQTANLVVTNALTNTGEADINSLGDINIGSDVAVQTSGYLTGNAVSILNQSSTIEATGNLRLAADTITNQRTVVGLEYGPSWTGTPVVNTPVQGGPTVYSYTPTYANQQFTATTTPAAQLLSGTSMSISGSTLNNNYSSIITGGTLTAQMAINNYGPAFLKSETRSGTSSVWVSTYHPQQGSCGFFSNGCVHPYVSWALVTAPYSSTQIPTPISGLNYTNQNSLPSAYLAAKSNSTVALPTSSLYTIHPQPGQPYLVVTDPRFANYANFISSDYMLSRLSLNPQQMQMRLGDGFYEQQLMTQQIIANTGHIYLGGYTDAEAQFIALMNSGVDAAKDFNLTVGVALSAAQINSLKHDIVWMVDREVTLPNGTVEHVLAPQVYLSSLQEADLKPSGALIAANVININSNSVNNSGTIRADTALSINVERHCQSGRDDQQRWQQYAGSRQRHPQPVRQHQRYGCQPDRRA